MRAELERHELGVLDEMGVGALHAGYADAFFPGTSVLQTRARYLLRPLDLPMGGEGAPARRPRTPPSLKEKAESWLTRRLLETEKNKGIIGGDTYPRPPAQPADFAYWTALRTFHLHEGDASRAQLLARWDRHRILRREDIRRGDEDVDAEPLACFEVPEVPDWWMDEEHEVSFSLERREADPA